MTNCKTSESINGVLNEGMKFYVEEMTKYRQKFGSCPPTLFELQYKHNQVRNRAMDILKHKQLKLGSFVFNKDCEISGENSYEKALQTFIQVIFEKLVKENEKDYSRTLINFELGNKCYLPK